MPAPRRFCNRDTLGAFANVFVLSRGILERRGASEVHAADHAIRFLSSR